LGGGAYQVTAPSHDYASAGVFQISVTVNDSDPASIVGSNVVFVAAAPLSVVAISGGISGTEGAAISGATVAKFTDPDPAAVAGDFSASIDWGDGSPQTIGTISLSSGVFSVVGSHTYGDEGTYTINVLIQGNGVDPLLAVNSATIADAALSAPAGVPAFTTQGSPLNSVVLGTFTDANLSASAADFLATIGWGDGSAPTTGFVHLIGGSATGVNFSVSGSHLYATSGVFPISITVLDDGGSSTSISTSATVSTSNLTDVAVFPIAAIEGAATPAGAVIGTFTDAGGADPVGNYTVTIAWGDGTTTSGSVAPIGGSSFNIIAPAHTYAEEGTFVVTVTVTDSDGSGPSSAANLAVVGDAALTASSPGPIAATEGAPLTGVVVATFTDANPGAPVSDFTATINWGDGSVSTGVVTQPGGVGTPFNVSGTHTYAEEGAYTVSVLIVDDGGSQASTTTVVNVAEAPITVNSTPLAIVGTENIELTNTDVATFTSSNPFETASSFLATISWGDGSPSTAGIITVDALKTFHISGSHTYTSTGSFAIVITITEADDLTLLAQTTASATIVSSPLIVNGVAVLGTEGIALPNAQNATNGTVVATFSDNGGTDAIADYTASIDWGNGLVTPGTIIPVGGPNFVVIAPTAPSVTYAEEGLYTVHVTITDSDNNTSPGFFQASTFSTATVRDANLTADPSQPTVAATQQLMFTSMNVSKFTDANPTAPVGDFSATIDWGDGTPASAGIVVQPGGVGTAFFVTGNHIYAQPTTAASGPYVVRATIHDAGGKVLVTSTTAQVVASTITGTSVTIPATESQPISNAIVAYFTDSGVPGPVSSYSASINWGTGAPATIGQIVLLGGNSFAVEGSFTYSEENLTPGVPYVITVTVNHNGVPATTILSAAQVADAPIVGVAVPVFATEGAAVTGTVGFFTDTDPAGTGSDYTAVIHWGDGTNSSGTIVPNGSGWSVTGADPVSGAGHVYAEEGSYAFSVTVTDAGGSQFTAFQTAAVIDAALTATAVNPTVPEFPAFSGVVATFTDADPAGTVADYSATINWGNGIVQPGTINIGPTGLFQVSGTQLFDQGTFPVIVTIHDAGGAVATAISTITVTDSPLTAGAAVTIHQVEGKAFETVVGTYTDPDLNATIADFSASIAWGDGSSSAGVLGELTSGSFQVTGSHTYAEEGTYTETITVKDVGGSTVTLTGTALVGDAKLTSQGTSIVSTEGGLFSSAVATFTDANPNATAGEFAVGVDWGDGTANPTTEIAVQGNSPNGVTFIVGSAHIYAQEGHYTVTIVIVDAGGSRTVATTQATVVDANLTASPLQPTVSGTDSIILGGPVVAFLDGNPKAVSGDFQASIDWGDGTPRSTGTISDPGGPGFAFLVTGFHTYDDPRVTGGNGTFNITVTITDDGGETLTVNNTATVADVPIVLSGRLNPASDTGASHLDGITDNNNPNFFGNSEPGSSVTLVATPVSGGAPEIIGQGTTDSDGFWSITSSTLVDASYNITAVAVDKFDETITTSPIVIGTGNLPLVIDTVGPKVTSAVFSRLTGQISVTFQDDRSGMNFTDDVDAANYVITKARSRPFSLLVTALTTTGGPTGPVSVAVTLNHGARLRGGRFLLDIHSNNLSGIEDIAGNALDGEFYGFFPSGNNIPGGDFVAQLDSIHHKVFPPSTTIGTASPLTAPGTRPPTLFLPGNGRTVTTPQSRLLSTQVSIAPPAGAVQDAALQALLSSGFSTKHVKKSHKK
jgi:large repetitive protein